MQVTNSTTLDKYNPLTKERVLKKIFKNSSKEDKISFKLVCSQWNTMISHKDDLRTPKRQVFSNPEICKIIFKDFNTKELSILMGVCKIFRKNIACYELIGNLNLFKKYRDEYIQNIPITKYVIPHAKGIIKKKINGTVAAKTLLSSSVTMLGSFIPATVVWATNVGISETLPMRFLKDITNPCIIRNGKKINPVYEASNSYRKIIGSGKGFRIISLKTSNSSKSLAYAIFNHGDGILLGMAALAGLTALIAQRKSIKNYFWSHAAQTESSVKDRAKVKIGETILDQFHINPLHLPKFPVLCMCNMDKNKPSSFFSVDRDLSDEKKSIVNMGNKGGHIKDLDSALKDANDGYCDLTYEEIDEKSQIPLVAFLSDTHD